MPLIRNPFRKTNHTTQTSNLSTDSYQSISTNSEGNPPDRLNSNSHSSALGTSSNSHNSGTISIPSKEDEHDTFKLSVVNDSGVFIPPSPPERSSVLWRRKQRNGDRAVVSTFLDEPFTISRESFESYRRSFDISARSPITTPTWQSPVSQVTSQRTSLDSKLSSIHGSPSLRDDRTHSDDGFEETRFDGPATRPKKRGIFSKFGSESTPTGDPSARASAFKFSMRKDPTPAPQESELARIKPPAQPQEIAANRSPLADRPSTRNVGGPSAEISIRS